MTVDCSKGILYETVAFQHLVRLVRDVARTLNESVESLDVDFTYISLSPKLDKIGAQNQMILMFGRFAVLRLSLIIDTKNIKAPG